MDKENWNKFRDSVMTFEQFKEYEKKHGGLARHSSDKKTLEVAVNGTDKEKLWALNTLLEELLMTEYLDQDKDHDDRAILKKSIEIVERIINKI